MYASYWNILLPLKENEVAQLCLTLCDSLDCSLPNSSIHGILQARILEWVAISFSRGSSRSRDQNQAPHNGGRRFNLWATREAPTNGQIWALIIQGILANLGGVCYFIFFFKNLYLLEVYIDTAWRSNQSILRDINPEYSWEGLMLKLKLQYFGHLMQIANSLEKSLMLGKLVSRIRGHQRMRWLNGITQCNGHKLGQTPRDDEG